MNVALPKPGFGRVPDRPSFDKKSLAAKKNSGTTATASKSTLKESVSKQISTATVSTECRTRAASTKSSTPFIAATHNMSVYDYKRDNTVSVPHGAIRGNHQLASDMGMTGRSVDRLIKEQEARRMEALAMINSSYGNNYGVQQSNMSLGDLVMTTLSMVKESGLFNFGGSKESKAKGKETVSDNNTIASMQNAKTSSELGTAINSAKNAASGIGTKLSTAKAEITKLKGQTSGLKSASDNAAKALTDNKTAVQNKTGEVQNNINRESSSQMAMNAAQTQVDMLQKQLDALPPDSSARLGLESSLKGAKEQLELKKQQYEQAVADREQSQQDLQELKGQTQGLESKATTAKADYENNVQTISSKESEAVQLEKEQKEINDALSEHETRLNELKKQEENDKK